MKTDSGDLDWRRELLHAVRSVFDSEREWLHSQLQAFMTSSTQMDLTPLLDQLKKLFQKQVLSRPACDAVSTPLIFSHLDLDILSACKCFCYTLTFALSGGAAVEIFRAAVQRRPPQSVGWGAQPACKHPAESRTATSAAGFTPNCKRTGNGNTTSAE